MPNQNDIELRSEEVQEILTRVPHWMIRWGNFIILLLLLLVMLFSYFMKYPDILTTQVVITTQNPPQKLVARTSGKIEKILIENKAIVQTNTPLAIIENTSNYEDVFVLKQCLDTLSVKENSFYFPIERFTLLQLGEIQNTFALFEKDYLAYDLNRDLKPYVIEKTAQGLESNQQQERYRLLQQQYQLSQTEIVLKKKELDRYKTLFEKGIIAAQEWESKNLDYLQAEKNLKNMSSQLSQLRSSLNDLNKSTSNTKFNETKDNINLHRNVLQSLNQLKKAIHDWELAYVLRSSISGEVSFMQIWTENQTISSGEQVFTIVPKESDSYIAKLKAPAQNSGKIKEGQNVNIRLVNFPDREFGMIKGKIKTISLTPDKEGNLLIDVTLPNGIQTSYNKKITFQHEMSGTADIITEDLRLIERLLYQFRDLFKR